MQRIISMTGAGDTIWLRDFYLRLFRWRHEQLTSADDIPEVHRKGASFIHAGRSGNLWIGSSGGKLVLRSPKGEVRTYEPGIGIISCMLEDAHGAVWAGGEEGLSRFTGSGFTRVTRQNGFTGDVKSIVEDELGFVWVGNGSGILRLDPSEVDKVTADPAYQVRFRLFNTADGVAGVPFSEGSRSGVRSPDGRLWFITSSGVTIVDPRNIGEPLGRSVRQDRIDCGRRASVRSRATTATACQNIASADWVRGVDVVRSDARALSLSSGRVRPRLGGRGCRATGHLHEPPATRLSISSHGKRRRRELGSAQHLSDIRHPADVLPDSLVLSRLRIERVPGGVPVVASARSSGAPPVCARACRADSDEPRHSRHAAARAGRA